MRHHFHKKVAYQWWEGWGGENWLWAPGESLVFFRKGPSDAPPADCVFPVYTLPGDDEWVHHCDHNGDAWERESTDSNGGRHVRTNARVVLGSMPVRYEAHPDSTEDRVLIVLIDADGRKGGHLADNGMQWLLMQHSKSVPFRYVVMTDTWDSPQSWKDADLTGVDFRGMGDVLPRVGDWTRADMAGAVFDGLDLTAVRFDGAAKLAGASLRGVDLSAYDLRAANLDGADLTGADLAGADFTEASMVGTDFAGARFAVARFHSTPRFSTDIGQRTSFAATDLSSVHLSHWVYLDLRDATLPRPGPDSAVDARHADLRGARPKTASTLIYATLDDALLTNTDLSEFELVGVSFKRCDLTRTMLPTSAQNCVFDALDLTAVRLPGSMDGCSFVDADLSGLSLNGVSLRGADLTRARLVDTQLEGADLTGAILDSADLTGTVLVGADLRGASLRSATLHRASLSSARLDDADLTQAQLGATRRLFAMPDVQRVTFEGPGLSEAAREAFSRHGVVLSRAASLTASDAHDGWLLADGNALYRIAADRPGGGITVHEYLSTDQAAVLTTAYMPNAVFDQAELFGVNMSGAHWYGSRASALGANLEQIEASGANLGQVNLVRAKLMGAGLSSAILAGANLSGAQLGTSAQGVSSSLHRAHLAGADLTGAILHNAVMTDAAVAVSTTVPEVVGVPLFALDARHAATLDGERLDDALVDAFIHGGYRLADDAEVTTIRAGTAWSIGQGHDDPQQMANRYARLGIVQRDGALHVHGSVLWITRLGADGRLETIRFSYTATVLTADEMNAQTTCPNGRPWSVNQDNREPWHRVMTALARPPQPPDCIPDPDSWDCPIPDAAVATEAAV